MHAGLSWVAILLLVLLLVFAALSIGYGGRAAWSDAMVAQTRWEIRQWRLGVGTVASAQSRLEAREELQAALRHTPDSAQLWDDLGYLDTSLALELGRAGSQDHALLQSLLSSATASYRTATRLRPTFPHSWAYLAWSKNLRGEHDSEFWLAFDKALFYGDTEASVQPMLARLAFANWPALGAARQTLVIAMVASAPTASRDRLKAIAANHRIALPNL